MRDGANSAVGLTTPTATTHIKQLQWFVEQTAVEGSTSRNASGFSASQR